MTYGVGEGGSQQHRDSSQGKKKNPSRGSSGNDFAHALARMAVAQICESVEIGTLQQSHAREGARFSSFQESALEKLTDVAIQYIQNVGKTTQFYANVAGRAEGNALDVVRALEDLGSGLGFDGADDVVERCLDDSGVVKDIVRYAGEAEEVPFVYSLPRFPFNRGKRRAPPSFSEVGAEMPDEHIPVWLPAFPETKMSNELEEETNDEKIEEEVKSKENGLSLDTDRLKVQKYMDQKDAQEQAEEPEGNPFLAAPVWVREKDVPPVLCPSEPTKEEASIGHVPETQTNKSHHIPFLEAHALPGMINDESRLGGMEDGQKADGARTQRALLRFKIGTRKTSVKSLEDKDWFLDEGDKREKKVEGEEKLETIDTDVK